MIPASKRIKMITDSVVIILVITFVKPKTSFALSCYGIYMLSLFTGGKLIVVTAVTTITTWRR